MEWRDVAMILIGVLSAVSMLLYNTLKATVDQKADKEHMDEDRRRLNSHDSSIGELFSKIHDSDMDTAKMHLEIVQSLNQNHLALLSFLRNHSAKDAD